ncbi:MAG TPA: FGGY-family carbohydrate kinase [Deltaproteobacteria bacterium]|nr:FGGY-family carbohydrate kinase [Deltaproteobacteria bacterium]
MRNEQYILAIDHGTSGIKSCVISTRGVLMGSDFYPTPIHFLDNGGAEQNPNDWWNGVRITARNLTDGSVVDPRNIIAVCVSSTFSTTVCVDKNGRHLMNALTWMDSRGSPYVRRLMKGFPSVMGYSVAKMLKWLPRTAGGPTLSGKDDIAHVLLVKNEYPDVYANTHMFLPSKDYLNLRLTGKFAASYDSMQLFWLSDIRDVDSIHYDDELMCIAGIDPAKLPPMKRSIDVLGTLSPEAARDLGLSPEVSVVVGSPDHQAACIGSGAVKDYEGHIYVGTSSWVQCIIPFKKTDVLHSIASFPTAVPGRYQSVNEQDIAGGCLDFLVGNIMYGDQGVLTADPPENVYERIEEIAHAVPPGSHGLIFTPWLNGERTPVDDQWVRAGLYNISKTTTFNHIVRAFLEGVAYNTRWSMGYVEKFIGRKMDPLNIIGGGARLNIWCQIFADVLGREIRQVKDPLQANARGAAFIASVALGEISFDEVADLVQYSHTYCPSQANARVYDKLFKEYKNIYRNNRSMFARLNSNR